jgi:hypothetical protein
VRACTPPTTSSLFSGQEKWLKDKYLLEVADCLATVGALAAGTQLWLELVTSSSVPIAESFESCTYCSSAMGVKSACQTI